MLETTVPRSISIPARATWRVVAAFGIARDGSSFLDGDVPIYDLAFVGNESPARPRGAGNAWQDRNQADILAGRYSSDHAVATIDFDLLADGANAIADGDHARVPHVPVPLRPRPRRRHPPWPEPYKPELWTKLGMPATTRRRRGRSTRGRYQPYGV